MKFKAPASSGAFVVGGVFCNSNQAIVCCWHLAPFRSALRFVHFWSNSGQLATELVCKRHCRLRVDKIPAQIVLTVLAATAPKTRFDAAHVMKVLHRIEPLAETIQQPRDLDDVRELPLNGFVASAAFVAHEVRQ